MCLIVVKVEYFNGDFILGLLPLEVENSSIFFFCFWLLVLDLHCFVVIIIIIIIPMHRIGSWVNYKLNSKIDGVRCRLLDALHFYVPICVMSLIHVCSLLWLTQKILYSLYHQWPFLSLFLKEFQLIASTLDDSSLSSDQALISFWCRRELNPISLIQLLETLSVELIGTHNDPFNW